MPLALDQEGPAPPEFSASSGFVVAHCFGIPGGRAFPADFTAAVAAALSTPFALGQEGPASAKLSASVSFCLGTLLCEFGRPSFTNRLCACRIDSFSSCRGTLLRSPKRPSSGNISYICCSNGCAGRATVSGPR